MAYKDSDYTIVITVVQWPKCVILVLKLTFLDYLGQGTLGYNATSKLAFGHFSSPTNIPTHSS